jgi:hypothetical protein
LGLDLAPESEWHHRLLAQLAVALDDAAGGVHADQRGDDVLEAQRVRRDRGTGGER